jgi:hypothetical protein
VTPVRGGSGALFGPTPISNSPGLKLRRTTAFPFVLELRCMACRTEIDLRMLGFPNPASHQLSHVERTEEEKKPTDRINWALGEDLGSRETVLRSYLVGTPRIHPIVTMKANSDARISASVGERLCSRFGAITSAGFLHFHICRTSRISHDGSWRGSCVSRRRDRRGHRF